MPKSKPPEVRRLEQLLHSKLIPWAQENAPLVLLDTPPQSTKPRSIRSQKSAPLEAVRKSSTYPQRSLWPKQNLNAIGAIVVGCVSEGEADYRVHTLPDFAGREWIVPVEAGTFFVVPPNTAFSGGGRIPWERARPEAAFTRGILIHLRRDGVSCHTYTVQNGKLWIHPYIFLFEFEAAVSGEKLLMEMRRENGLTQGVSHLYLQLILRLLGRALENNEFATLHIPAGGITSGDEELPAPLISSGRVVEFAAESIRRRISEVGLSSQSVAQGAGLSQRHLNRLFFKELKVSVAEYIQQQRDEKACDLLANGALSMGAVAAYCGFRRPAVFSAWFSRRHGCTPSAFRQRQFKSERRN